MNENQLEADRFAVEKAKKDLDAAKTKLKVLDEFTKPKQVSTLESAILIAKAKWESARTAISWKSRSSGHRRSDRQVHDDRAAGWHRQVRPRDRISAATSSSSSRKARLSASGKRSSSLPNADSMA